MEVQGQPRTPPGGNMLSMRSATRLIAGRMRSPYNPPLPARLFRRASSGAPKGTRITPTIRQHDTLPTVGQAPGSPQVRCSSGDRSGGMDLGPSVPVPGNGDGDGRTESCPWWLATIRRRGSCGGSASKIGVLAA